MTYMQFLARIHKDGNIKIPKAYFDLKVVKPKDIVNISMEVKRCATSDVRGDERQNGGE